MDMQYRGVNYKADQTVVETSSEVIGMYRGAVASRHVAVQAAARPQGLRYRGAVVR